MDRGEKQEILAIIPARGGSKGIHKKNLVSLCGKPLIKYTIDAAKGSRIVSRIILSSDDERIIDYCVQRGVDAPFKRPEKLARDDTPMIDVVKHTLGFLKEKEAYKPQYIILLQPTSPLRTSRHIDEALERLIKADVDSMVSVVEIPHQFNPYSAMRLEGGYLKPFLSFDERRNIRHLKPKLYARNGPAISAFTYDCIFNKNSMFGERIIPYFMKEEESIDIDDACDLMMAEAIIKRFKH